MTASLIVVTMKMLLEAMIGCYHSCDKTGCRKQLPK